MARNETLAKQLQPFDDMMQAIASAELRGREIKQALRVALRPVKKRVEQLIPPPGYPGDKKELKALRDTVEIRTRDLGIGVWFGIVGPTWSAGAHAYMVEHGTARHQIGIPKENPERFIDHPGAEGREYMARAWESLQGDTLTTIQKLVGQEFVDAVKSKIRAKVPSATSAPVSRAA